MGNPSYVTRRAESPPKPPCETPEPGTTGARCSNYDRCRVLHLACNQFAKYCGTLHGNPKQTRVPTRKLYHRMNRVNVERKV